MREAVAARQNATHGRRDPRDELAVYLSSPLEDMSDIVAWWGVSTSFIYLVRGSYPNSSIHCSIQRFHALRVIICQYKVAQFHQNAHFQAEESRPHYVVIH